MKNSLISILLCLGLVACSATDKQQEVADTAAKTDIEEVVADTPEVDAVTTQPAPDAEVAAQAETVVEAEVKPKPEPQTKPAPKPVKTSDGKLILGGEEWVYVPGLEENFNARIDSGATTSSVSAVDIVPFEREGKDWVKFRIEHDAVSSKEINLPIVRWVKIKQANSAEVQKRAVVTAWIQVGDLKEKAEFTLTDRKHLSHPMILGRSFFRDIAVVDVSRNFVQPKFVK